MSHGARVLRKTNELLRLVGLSKSKPMRNLLELFTGFVVGSLYSNFTFHDLQQMNFMLSLAEEGIGSKWMTGALGAAPEDVMAAVGAPAGEKLMGAIWYGYPAKDLAEDAKAPPRKKGLDGVLTACP